MSEVRCPFCHKYVERRLFASHQAKHLKKKPDGQHTDYVTLPEDEREQGSLDDVPSVYVHEKCNVATRMPEEIIRSYLQNPYLYDADATFCCGCRRHVPNRQCHWTETGENLQDYFDDLRDAKPEMKPKGCMALIAFIGMGLALLISTKWLV